MKDVILNGETLMIKKSETKVLKSESFNRTKIVCENTKEVLFRLVKDRFLTLKWYQDPERNELVKLLINVGMTKEADELISMT